MNVLLAALSILAGLSIPVTPLSTAFFPRLGRTPLRLGQNRRVRAAQAGLVWLLALGSLAARPRSAWGWVALFLALPFSFLAARFFPQKILVALDHPTRAADDPAPSATAPAINRPEALRQLPPVVRAPQIAPLGPRAPVLVFEHGGEVVAYPLELLVPHHLINDVVGRRPILAAW